MLARRFLCICAFIGCFQLVVRDGWAAENWLLEVHGNVMSSPSAVSVSPAATQDDCANTGGATCGAATHLGTICGDMGDDVITLSQCGQGWFKCFLSECQSGFSPVDLRLVVRLVPPAGGVDYDLYLYEPCGALVAYSARGPGEAEEVSILVSDAFGMDDSRFFYVEIRSHEPTGVRDSGAGLTTPRLLVESFPNPMNTVSLIATPCPLRRGCASSSWTRGEGWYVLSMEAFAPRELMRSAGMVGTRATAKFRQGSTSPAWRPWGPTGCTRSSFSADPRQFTRGAGFHLCVNSSATGVPNHREFEPAEIF
jgi:hypothetical protein